MLFLLQICDDESCFWLPWRLGRSFWPFFGCRFGLNRGNHLWTGGPRWSEGRACLGSTGPRFQVSCGCPGGDHSTAGLVGTEDGSHRVRSGGDRDAHVIQEKSQEKPAMGLGFGGFGVLEVHKDDHLGLKDRGSLFPGVFADGWWGTGPKMVVVLEGSAIAWKGASLRSPRSFFCFSGLAGLCAVLLHQRLPDAMTEPPSNTLPPTRLQVKHSPLQDDFTLLTRFATASMGP